MLARRRCQQRFKLCTQPRRPQRLGQQGQPGVAHGLHVVGRNCFYQAAPPASPPPPQSSPALAFDDCLRALSGELETYGRPVAYLHGDTHTFRIDKPLFSRKTNRVFQNFTRVETFGWQDSHWIRITVDPADPQLFRFKAEVVPGNTVNGER